jgi:hypothetical protein
MTTQLIVLENIKAVDVFVENGLDPYLLQIEQEVRSFEPDVTSLKGRKAIGSLARKIGSSKAFLDNAGKELNAEAKLKAKLVDNERKRCREFLDSLRDEVRAPLLAYEEQIKQKEAEQLAKYTALKEIASTTNWEGDRLTIEELSNSLIDLNIIEIDESYGEYELAALKAKTKGVVDLQTALDEETKRIENEKRLEQERIETLEQERLAYEAETKRQAKLNAERELQQQVDRANKEKQDAIEAAAKAEQDRIDAENKAKTDAEAAERRRLQQIEQAQINAENEKQRAIQAEKQRQADEQARLAEEQRKREANKAHKAAINNEVLQSLLDAGVSKEQAKTVVIAIAKGLVAHTTIHY